MMRFDASLRSVKSVVVGSVTAALVLAAGTALAQNEVASVHSRQTPKSRSST
jgi:hypothetical protein